MQDETLTAFIGTTRAAQGTREMLAQSLAHLGPHPEGLLVFSDDTGRETDIDFTDSAPRTRGRPKLGVTAREVTLLPRHWDWLAAQRGGASATLRRLIDAARDTESNAPTPDRAYRFLTAIAGNLPRYEDAIRALYANDIPGFEAAMTDWPADIATHATTLAGLT